MDELEISGKRYISAKRIAKENRYHPDYVGQLIRAGRISGTKVGRAWYVDEVSFIQYLGKERGTFGAPAIQSPEPEFVTEPAQARPIGSVEPRPDLAPASAPDVVVQEESVTASFATVEPAYVPAPEIVAVTESNTADEGAPQRDGARTEQFPSKEIVYPEAVGIAEGFTKPMVVEKKPVFKTSLTYIPDNSPLFPAIQKRTKPVETKKDEYVVAQIAKPTHTAQPTARPKRSGWKTGYAVAGVAAVAAIFFSFAFFGSLGINSTVIVEKGKPASVVFAQEKTFCFIFNTCQK